MMFDLQRSDVHMHDVRMQLVDVFRWGGSEKWVPHRAQWSSAVKIGSFPLQMDVQE